MNLRAYIVDDERLARENLKMLLESFCPDVEVIGEAGNITDAEEGIRDCMPDLLFLDIRMPSDAEGFQLLERIKDLNVIVIFVTAFKDYAVKAFNANAAYYVLKPVDIEELQLAVQKVMDTKRIFDEDDSNFDVYQQTLKQLSEALLTNKHSGRFAIAHTKGLKIVEEKNVMYFEAQGNCTMLYFNDGTKYLDTRTLKTYESIVDPNAFFRIHKSYLANLSYMVEYLHSEGHYIVLSNKVELPVARNRVSDFIKVLKGL
jgi:two-component system, LytTR family, response regulator